jgi:putative heme iron utilization protein
MRQKLGFDNKGHDEVQDDVLESLEEKSKEYKKKLAEQKERKTAKLITKIDAMSKDEIKGLLFNEDEKFK